MATREDIYTAMRNADAAGDSASVQKLAAYLQTMSTESAAPAAPSARYTSMLPDGANAVATGINQGALRLLGLPADTAANVWELGKAALGSAYLAATPRDGKHPLPAALEPNDRSNMIGTGDWLIKKAAQASPGTVLAQNPEYDNGYLQAAGSGLAAVANPGSKAELAQQIGTGIAGSLASKAAVDITGNPAAGVIGALAPHAAAQGVTAATKAAIRGGETGRQAMAQRVSDLQAAGIENPTLGLASGSNLIGGVENLLSSTPGAVGIMRNAREAVVSGMQAKTDAAAANASGNRGTMESGKSIQSGVQGFRDSAKATQAGLYDKLDNYIPGTQAIPVGQTGAALDRLTATIPGAAETSKSFINGKISSIKQGFDVDTGTVPSGPSSTQTVPMLGAPAMRTNAMGAAVPEGATRINAMGLPVPAGNLIGTRTDVIPPKAGRSGPFSGLGVQDDSPPTLPFQAVKQLRTSVGTELNNNALVQDAPKAQWKQLYGAMSGDIQDAATAAGPQAAGAFNRANDYTRASIGRMERVAPLVEKDAPEQTFQAANRTLAENTSTFQALKKTLPEGARGDFAGTVIERLGKATPGQQDSTGGAWSPETFLTNWNRMAPKARDELLSGFPNSDQVRADVQKVADAASQMRSSSKMWANPSGTSANVAARGTLGAIGAGAALAPFGLVNPVVPLAAAGGVGAANLIARGVTSKSVRDAVLRPDSPSAPLTWTDLMLLNGVQPTEEKRAAR